VLVPFNMKLYSEFDKQLGHFRRYGEQELENKFRAAGFEVEKQFYFNKVGVFAWYAANTLGKQSVLKPWQLKVYNFFTPIFRVLDQILPTKGLSTVVVGRKPAAIRADVREGAGVAAAAR